MRMEKNRKQKLLMIVALVFCIASLSVGFAAFSTTLNISSSASVTPNSDTFSVKFSLDKDTLLVWHVSPSSVYGNASASNGTINNATNPTLKDIAVTFTKPGEYVEYTFYARNEGEYTAYLNNINFIGNKTCKGEAGATDSLVQSACESINVTATIGNITYTETTPITGHVLEKEKGEEIKLRFEYASNGAYVDGSFTIKFPDLALVYSTLDDSTIMPTLPVRPVVISGDYDTVGSEICIKEECFYVISSTEDTVTMLAKYNLLVGNSVDENRNVTPLSNPTGIQDETAKGCVNGSTVCIGTVPFAEDFDQLKGLTYEGSIVEGYVNNYVSYLESLGINISDVRLITKDELEKLGCSSENFSCIEALSWVYSTHYWTGIIYNSQFWGTEVDGVMGEYIGSRSYNDNSYFGVRPVITISKSEF